MHKEASKMRAAVDPRYEFRHKFVIPTPRGDKQSGLEYTHDLYRGITLLRYACFAFVSLAPVLLLMRGWFYVFLNSVQRFPQAAQHGADTMTWPMALVRGFFSAGTFC
jgi:hypothetical protein